MFALTLVLWAKFDPRSADFQMVERIAWIPAFGIDYYVGVDGISLLLVVLTGFLTPIALLSSWHSVDKKTKEFSFFILALESAMIGVFLSLDLFLFYVFWDAMLIPMYFLIGIWGYDRRVYAAVKFILYTMAGSVLMLVAHHRPRLAAPAGDRRSTRSTSLKLYTLQIAPSDAVPGSSWPLRWRSRSRCRSSRSTRGCRTRTSKRPPAGSIILAGVLLKMGTYGLVRFAFPLFPEAAVFFAPKIAVLAVIGIVYGALVAMVQPDMKKLVAYSSVSHLGVVVLGICAMNMQSLQGAVYQMLAHGVSTGGLFLIVGMLSDRRHTRLIAEYGGLKHVDAASDRGVPAHHAGVDRSADLERLHRRVPDHPRQLCVEVAVRRRRGERRDSVGRLHAVDGAACVLRARHEPEEPVAAGSRAARVGGGAAAGRRGHRDGCRCRRCS